MKLCTVSTEIAGTWVKSVPSTRWNSRRKASLWAGAWAEKLSRFLAGAGASGCVCAPCGVLVERAHPAGNLSIQLVDLRAQIDVQVDEEVGPGSGNFCQEVRNSRTAATQMQESATLKLGKNS